MLSYVQHSIEVRHGYTKKAGLAALLRASGVSMLSGPQTRLGERMRGWAGKTKRTALKTLK
jgi:hypothetical protein